MVRVLLRWARMLSTGLRAHHEAGSLQEARDVLARERKALDRHFKAMVHSVAQLQADGARERSNSLWTLHVVLNKLAKVQKELAEEREHKRSHGDASPRKHTDGSMDVRRPPSQHQFSTRRTIIPYT